MSSHSNGSAANTGSPQRRPSDTTAAPMAALTRDAYGSAEFLHISQVPRPTPGPGGVLVRVHGAGLDRGAWHIMTGRPYLMRLAGFGLRQPKNSGLGSELSGVVEAVGADAGGFDRICPLADLPAAIRDLELGAIRGKVVTTLP